MSRIEIIGDATLILGDCREWLGGLPECFTGIDGVLTDPPYGVNLGDRPSATGKTAYLSYEDTPENIAAICVPVIAECVARFGRVVLTPGIRNLFSYPIPQHVGSFYYPSGAGCNAWGFTCWQPILYYGKDPWGGSGSRPDSFYSVEGAEKNGHPCPKPIGQMRQLVNRSSLPGETILDPFMGSGTTGVACAELGRRFVGIEIEPTYFDIACRRIAEAYKQPRLFADERAVTPAAQTSMQFLG